MDRRLRIIILDGSQVIVLVHRFRRRVATGYAAEQTRLFRHVLHCHLFTYYCFRCSISQSHPAVNSRKKSCPEFALTGVGDIHVCFAPEFWDPEAGAALDRTGPADQLRNLSISAPTDLSFSSILS